MADVPPFTGTPQLKSTELRTYQEVWRCPTQACQGEMAFYGFPNRPPYAHKCPICGFAATLPNDCYPRTYQEPIGGP